MKRIKMNWQTVLIVLLLLTANCLATVVTNYVVPPGTAGASATDPYTSWATAGTSIIEVVNAAANFDSPRTVLVTNGIYNMTNEIYTAASSLTIRSVNGRELTSLNGQSTGPNGFYTNRCINCTGSSGIFDGFTVSNYYLTLLGGRHGLVYGMASVLNCTFVGNTNKPTATYGRGGALNDPYTVTNCIFRSNYASIYGGAIAVTLNSGSVLISGCIFENNVAAIQGGGIQLTVSGGSAIISNCVFRGNSANAAVYGAGGGMVINNLSGSDQNLLIVDCTIISNTATSPSSPEGGGGIRGRDFILRNCLIAQNYSKTNGGGVSILSTTTNSFIESCTIASNSTGGLGGGIHIPGTNVTGVNNIIYYNTATVGGDNFTNTTGNAGFNNSCVIPAVDGTANITNDPLLVNFAGGNYRLSPRSPCVNTGTNQSWMANSFDLDRKQRIRYGTVDMGCYERICGGTIYKSH